MLNFFTSDYLESHPDIKQRAVYQPIKEFLLENLQAVRSLSEDTLFWVLLRNRYGRRWSLNDYTARKTTEDDIQNLTPEAVESKLDDTLALMLCLAAVPDRIYDYCQFEEKLVRFFVDEKMEKERYFDGNFFITRELEPIYYGEDNIDIIKDKSRNQVTRFQLIGNHNSGTIYNSYGDLRVAYLEEALHKEPADMTVYQSRSLVPQGETIIDRPKELLGEIYGDSLSRSKLYRNKKVKDLIKKLNFQEDTWDITYDCKMAILAYLHPFRIYDITQCSETAQCEILLFNRGRVILDKEPYISLHRGNNFPTNCLVRTYKTSMRIRDFKDLFRVLKH